MMQKLASTTPDRKNQSGWIGPANVHHIDNVCATEWGNGVPMIISQTYQTSCTAFGHGSFCVLHCQQSHGRHVFLIFHSGYTWAIDGHCGWSSNIQCGKQYLDNILMSMPLDLDTGNYPIW